MTLIKTNFGQPFDTAHILKLEIYVVNTWIYLFGPDRHQVKSITQQKCKNYDKCGQSQTINFTQGSEYEKTKDSKESEIKKNER